MADARKITEEWIDEWSPVCRFAAERAAVKESLAHLVESALLAERKQNEKTIKLLRQEAVSLWQEINELRAAAAIRKESENG